MARGAERADDPSAASRRDPGVGRMRAPRVSVDFVNRRAPATLAGAVLLLLGVSAAAAAYLEYRFPESRRAGLELKLQAATRRGQHDPTLDARAAGLTEAARRTAAGVATAWTKLLAAP